MALKLFRKLGLGGALAAGIATAAAWAAPSPAHACGGLFCSSSNPVNQAAEQIIFVDNPDGTVTAVIQILYEGPAHQFAWVLPVPGNPTVGVSSEQAFATIKGLTNPQYSLQTTFADGCGQRFAGSASGATPPPTLSPEDSDPGVSVVASGAIGPYEYDTIAVDPTADDPADVAIKWLADNGYDVGALGPDVLRPYLLEGLNLIAFKLDKNSSTGSIRPVMLTYESEHPSIPIRPTAVAANDDMGVMVFLLSSDRGIPQNYKALELNEALINWFNANTNYNEIVSLAADEAMGQGFVTEFAGPHASLGFQGGVQIFPDFQRENWQNFQAAQHADATQMIQEAMGNWGGWDGFDDALRAAVTLPADIAYADFKNCTQCYLSAQGVTFDTPAFLRQLYEMVIKPMQETHALFDSRPYLTRFYTTMSADEMTMDPVFAFNPDLDDVSNIHTATQVLECGKSGDPFGADAPWSVELPQGGSVRGAGNARVWPIDVMSQPAAIRIMQFGTSGGGKVLEDRTKAIAEQNPDPPSKPNTGLAGSGSTVTAGRGGSTTTPPKTATGGAGASAPVPPPDLADNATESDDRDGCSVAHARGSDALSLLLLAAIPLLRRRRR